MIKNRPAILKPTALEIYTDADDSSTFDPVWTFSAGTTGSRVFNGTTDRIDWANIYTPLSSSPITISMWIYPTRINTDQFLFYIVDGTTNACSYFWNPGVTAGSGYLAYGWNSNANAIVRTAGSVASHIVISTWQHVLVTYAGTFTDGTCIHIYRNGTEASSYSYTQNGSGTPFSANSDWSIGGYKPSDVYNLQGNIAQVGVWDRVITSTEIAGLASGIVPSAYLTNLKFYFAGDTSSMVAIPPTSTGTPDGTTWTGTNGPTLSPITMNVDYGDGTYTTSTSGVSKTYAAGKGGHKVRFTCSDWTRLTAFDTWLDSEKGVFPKLISKCKSLVTFGVSQNNFVGSLPYFGDCPNLVTADIYGDPGYQWSGVMPSFERCTGLVTLNLHSCGFYGPPPNMSTLTSLDLIDLGDNRFTGVLPSFASNTNLTWFECGDNLFTGAVPSFAACTKMTLMDMGVNAFSGTLPDMSALTKLTWFHIYNNALTGYTAGSFATQKSLSTLSFNSNSLTATGINAILHDLVTSLGIGGRVACAVDLQWNTAPTGQGIVDKATLVGTSGWSVITD